MKAENPFNPDGECKAWCFFELCNYLLIDCSANQLVEVSTNIDYRFNFFERNGVNIFCFVPAVAVLFPSMTVSLFKRPKKVMFSQSKFEIRWGDLIKHSGKKAVLFEGSAFSTYGINQHWPHSVLAIDESGKFKIVDGLAFSLYEEGLIKRIDLIDFSKLIRDSGIIKTVFLKEIT